MSEIEKRIGKILGTRESIVEMTKTTEWTTVLGLIVRIPLTRVPEVQEESVPCEGNR